jgi:hypothetical protein
LQDLEKKLDNAYVLELLEDLVISPTFNVVDLYEFHEGIFDEDEYITNWKRKYQRMRGMIL